MTERHNVLLILTDQHRYDIVGANGSPICQSPALDHLAAEGVNFSRAYSVCPLCTPARASIYTGLAPHNHGVTRNVGIGEPNAPSIGGAIPTIAERLTQAGYISHYVGKWHAGGRLPTACGFEGMDVPGYGDIHNSPYYLDYLAEHGLEGPQPIVVGTGYSHNLLLAGRMSGPVEASVPYFLAERAIEELQARATDDQPFFLALNFWGPHAPYLPCEPYASMYDPAHIPPWGNFDDDFAGKPPIYRRHRDAMTGEGQPTRTWDECARWAALYFGFATQIDDQIGRVLGALDALGLAETTAVLFSTDHGDFTGAHGGMHDKNSMGCEELTHIPLMARLPQQPDPGRTCDLHVSNLDIPATVLELAGLDVPASLDGRSLAPILQGIAPANWPDHVIGECFGVHFAYETRTVVWARHKYVYHAGAFDELYDLEADPWEMYNLINDPDHANAVRECRRRLLAWMRRTGASSHKAYALFEEPLPSGVVSHYGTGSLRELLAREPRLLDE